MDFLGVFFLVVIILEIIVINILFRRKLNIKEISSRKVKILYLIVSIISLAFVMFIVANSQVMLETYFFPELEDYGRTKVFRFILLNIIVVIYALLQFLIDKLFINRIYKKNNIEEYTEIGNTNEM